MSEEWRQVVGFEGLYEVSNLGRVKTVHRVLTRSNGAKQTVRERIRKQVTAQRGGYAMVTLTNMCHRTLAPVHRLVLEAFVGKRPDGMECCHIDGNPLNARLDNLRWGTPESNGQDRIRHGTQTTCAAHPCAKMTREQVIEARALRRSGVWTVDQIAQRYGVENSTMASALSGKTWKSVPGAIVGRMHVMSCHHTDPK